MLRIHLHVVNSKSSKNTHTHHIWHILNQAFAETVRFVLCSLAWVSQYQWGEVVLFRSACSMEAPTPPVNMMGCKDCAAETDAKAKAKMSNAILQQNAAIREWSESACKRALRTNGKSHPSSQNMCKADCCWLADQYIPTPFPQCSNRIHNRH